MTNEEFLQEAQELIQRVVEADTNNFLEIAKIAGIDLQTELVGANLSSFNLKGADLSGTNLWGANFIGADLCLANFNKADLVGANLSRANLRGTNLTNADFNEADLSDANFNEADLRGTNLNGAILWRANLSSANLSRAILTDADFRQAILTDADLTDADLTDADLSGANLSGADLRRANLSNAIFTNAKVDNALFGDNLGISEEMRQWLDKSQDNFRQQQQIEAAAQESRNNQQNNPKDAKNYLLQGKQLREAKEFHKQQSEVFPLSKIPPEFIEKSPKHRQGKRLKIIPVLVIAPLISMTLIGGLIYRKVRIRQHWDTVKANLSEEYNLSRNVALQNLNGLGVNLGDYLQSGFLQGADLVGIQLARANLSGANLSDTNLSGANFSDANLSNADFSDANLNGVNFSGTKVNNARFRGSVGISEDMKRNLIQRGAIFEDTLGNGSSGVTHLK